MALSATSVLPRNLRAAAKRESGSIQVSPRLIRIAALSAVDALSELATGPDGLTEEEAQRRLEEFGPNVVARDERFTRIDPDTLVYEFTVNEPTEWTRPWTSSPKSPSPPR